MNDRAQALSMLDQSRTAEGQNLPMAYQLLASSVVTDSTAAECWFRMGDANFAIGMRKSAIGCYRKALQNGMPPEMHPRVLNALAHSLYFTGQNDEASEYAERVVQEYPEFALGYFNLSMVESVKGYLDLALVHARKAYAMLPDNPPVELNLAFQLMFNGHMVEGLKHFEARFPYRLAHFAQYPYPKWEGQSEWKGQKTVVWCVSEQGIGDTLAYARYVRAAANRCSFLHLGVQPELARLFRASFQDVPNLNVIPQPCPFPPATHYTTFMSLPVALGMTDAEFFAAKNITIPPFTMSPTSWKDKRATLHIGVAWGGAKNNDIDYWRSFPIDRLLELYEVPGIQLYALQFDDRAQDIHSTGSITLIRDMRSHVRDVADTIAILRELDLVITCEGVIGHIAGAMNVPCWIAYSYQGRTVHLGHDPKGGPPFYPLHHVIKQGPDHDWTPVFRTIKEQLHDIMEKRVLQCGDGGGARLGDGGDAR